MTHRDVDRQVPQDFSPGRGDRYRGGNVVVDIDVDVAAGQNLLGIGGIQQQRDMAIGIGVKIGRHAN